MKDDYSWVVRGKQRVKIIKALANPKIPTQIKKDTDISLNNVSDVLQEFKKRKLATCINPKQRTGRIYELTKTGKRVREQVEEYGA